MDVRGGDGTWLLVLPDVL
jgi:hypothetical protein